VEYTYRTQPVPLVRVDNSDRDRFVSIEPGTQFARVLYRKFPYTVAKRLSTVLHCGSEKVGIGCKETILRTLFHNSIFSGIARRNGYSVII
jgi:hypothetical protein